MEQELNERAPMRQEQIEQRTISVREVLAYLETDLYMDLKEVTEYFPLSDRTVREHLKTIPKEET